MSDSSIWGVPSMWWPIPQFAASPVRNGAPVAATCPVTPTPTLIVSTSSTEPVVSVRSPRNATGVRSSPSRR